MLCEKTRNFSISNSSAFVKFQNMHENWSVGILYFGEYTWMTGISCGSASEIAEKQLIRCLNRELTRVHVTSKTKSFTIERREDGAITPILAVIDTATPAVIISIFSDVKEAVHFVLDKMV